jgi:hypothetical protein
MKLEPKWRQKSLDSLEKTNTTSNNSECNSYLVRTYQRLRKKPLEEFTTEDLRLMIGQESGLPYLIPLALEVLEKDLFAEGDLYEGDLLNAVLQVHPDFWKANRTHWESLNLLLSERRAEVKMARINLAKFESLGF